MKRFFCLLLVFCITFPLYGALSCHATEINLSCPENETIVSQTIKELPDGSSILITISEISVKSRAAAYQKSGSKTYSYKNENGTLLWQFTVSATFSVKPGNDAECIGSYHSYKIQDSSWKFVNGSSHYSANKAFGTGEFEMKSIGITLDTHECQVTLTCDTNGTLS